MSSSVNSKWRTATIILIIVAISQGINLYNINSSLRNTFHYDIDITIKDAETNEILEHVTTSLPSGSSSDLFHQSTTVTGGLKVSGIAYEPRVFGFSLAGYKTEKTIITKDTTGPITIKLKPSYPELPSGH